MSGEGSDDGLPSTDDVLAAYRARRKAGQPKDAAAEDAQANDAGPGDAEAKEAMPGGVEEGGPGRAPADGPRASAEDASPFLEDAPSAEDTSPFLEDVPSAEDASSSGKDPSAVDEAAQGASLGRPLVDGPVDQGDAGPVGGGPDEAPAWHEPTKAGRPSGTGDPEPETDPAGHDAPEPQADPLAQDAPEPQAEGLGQDAPEPNDEAPGPSDPEADHDRSPGVVEPAQDGPAGDAGQTGEDAPQTGEEVAVVSEEPEVEAEGLGMDGLPDAPPPSGLRTRWSQRVPIGPGAPELDLLPSLRRHPFVAPRGNRSGRVLGLLLLMGGLLALAWERRLTVFERTVPQGLLEAAAGLIVLGLLVGGLSLALPWHRRVTMALAHDQDTEWDRVTRMARRHRVLAWSGVVGLLAGLVLVVAAYGLPGRGFDLRLAALGALVVLVGLLLTVAAAARRGPLRRLYVQTLLLAWLERSGVAGRSGADDDRVRHVLLALDQLLGSLPDDAVQRFLESPAASDYLQLMDELREHHGT